MAKGATIAGLVGLDVALLVAIAFAGLYHDWRDGKSAEAGLDAWVASHLAWITNLTWVALITTGAVLYFWCFRRHRLYSVTFFMALGFALVSIWLGLTVFWRCPGEWRLLSGYIANVLELFSGSVASSSEQVGTCVRTPTAALEMARATALLAVFSGALGALFLLGRDTVDRLATNFARDVDVVVGLNPQTLPVVQALVTDNHARRSRESWMRFWPWFTRRALRHPWTVMIRTKVVVLDFGAPNELRTRARHLGARVRVTEPNNLDCLEGIINAKSWILGQKRIALRRLYAADDSLQVSANAFTLCRELIDPQRQEGLWRPHLDRVPPRMLLRLDSAGDAQEMFRAELGVRMKASNANAGVTDDAAPGVYLDSLCQERLMAAELVADLIPYETAKVCALPSAIWIFGGGTLALAIADELAWQMWCRYEVATYAMQKASKELKEAKESGLKLQQAQDALNSAIASLKQASEPRLKTIKFAGPDASARVKEWKVRRARWQFPDWAFSSDDPPPLQIPRIGVDRATGADRARHLPPTTVAIFASDDADISATARRLVHLANQGGAKRSSVYLFDQSISGLLTLEAGREGHGSYGVRLFGPSLVRRIAGVDGGNTEIRLASDFATRVAHQEHRCYRGKWDDSSISPAVAEMSHQKAANRDWNALGAFFQQENIRLVSKVVGELFLKDSALAKPSNSDPLSKAISDVAQNEHTRWFQLRQSHGWVAGDRNDSHLKHPLVKKWADLDPKDREFNEAMVRRILGRLWAMSLFPEDL